MNLSPARAKALRLHGRYLGYIRQLKPRQRAMIRGIRSKKGSRASIARAWGTLPSNGPQRVAVNEATMRAF